MKKLLVTLMVLVAAGAAASAQVVVGGYDRAKMTAYADGTVGFSNRARVNISYTNADKTDGAFIRLQTTGTGSLSPVVKLGYGWIGLLDNQIKISGGRMGNYDYTVGCGISEFNLGNLTNEGYEIDSTDGLMIEFKPAAVAGLALGAAWDVSSTGLSSLYTVAKYASDSFSVIATSRFNDTIADSRASLTVGVTPMEGLNAYAGFKYNMDVDDYQETHTGAMTPFAIVDYSADKLLVEVVPAYVINSNNGSENEIYVESSLEYDVSDPFAVIVTGAYDSTSEVLGSKYFASVESAYTVDKTTFDLGVNFDESGISVPAYIKARF